MVPRDHVFPAVPEIEFVRAEQARNDPDVFRVAGQSSALVPNAAMAYGLQDLRGYDGVTPGLHAELVGTAHKGGAYRIVRPGDPFHVLDLMNVRYVFTSPEAALPGDHFTRVFASAGGAVYRNERAFPRAFLASRARTAGARDALALIKSGAVDLRHEVLLDRSPEAGEAPDGAAPGEEGTARIVRYEDTVVDIDTDAAGRRLLVLVDLAYPGWTATVDGAPARVFRAYHALRAVSVPAGRHRVRFRFEPWSLRLGAWLSLAGVLATVGVAVAGRRRSGGRAHGQWRG
jgi:hypothetical protein